MNLPDILARLNPVAIPGAVLILVGLWGILSRQNLFKIAVAFSVMGTGANLLILSVGYIRGRTAPILDTAMLLDTGTEPGLAGSGLAGSGLAGSGLAAATMTDPVPQALVLTAIVIGLAVTALMLSYAVRLRTGGGAASIEAYGEEKW
jgi:multicomponent Na+:H+ antiporter subunit C